ncbi:MAG: hypothetical protein WD793_15145 [Steroidobacteraceae bacterium]
MSKYEVDTKRLTEEAGDLPPSPRDSMIKKLDMWSWICYGAAVICAWQIGGWWGIGLVVALFGVDALQALIQDQHREELLELHGKLVINIAENSSILKDKIPTKGRPL